MLSYFYHFSCHASSISNIVSNTVSAKFYLMYRHWVTNALKYGLKSLLQKCLTFFVKNRLSEVWREVLDHRTSAPVLLRPVALPLHPFSLPIIHFLAASDKLKCRETISDAVNCGNWSVMNACRSALTNKR